MIAARFKRKTGRAEERMREAIAVANNEILRLAAEHADWNGMASVVTAVLIEDGTVTVGHVGDSRLYLLEPGSIRKLTHDHSPVGELEDSRQITEAVAMAHPRRNEVFRDLGSEPHAPDDDEFIEVLRFPFRSNQALLICSDGLSDQVPSDYVRQIVELNGREPQRAVRELVHSANDAGGKDNVSVVLIEGPDYGVGRDEEPDGPEPPSKPRRAWPVLAFVAGFIAALAIFALLRPYIVDSGDGWKFGYGTVRPPVTWKVAPGMGLTISQALAQAKPGDTVLVEPGTYREALKLRSGIAVVSAQRRAAVLEGGDVVVLADGVQHARLAGFRIEGPAAVGIRILNSSIEVTDVGISGMRETAIAVEGESPSLIRANTIAENGGTGILVRGPARPAITNNVISGNGRTPGALRPGLHIAGSAEPVIAGNVIADSGVEQVWASPLFNVETLAASNFLAPGGRDHKNPIKVVTR
jgi:parallel beta-helix repeat protein